jgi:hypothetical protein
VGALLPHSLLQKLLLHLRDVSTRSPSVSGTISSFVSKVPALTWLFVPWQL